MNQKEKPLNCSEHVVISVRYKLDASSLEALAKLSQETFRQKVQKDDALILSHKLFSSEKS